MKLTSEFWLFPEPLNQAIGALSNIASISKLHDDLLAQIKTSVLGNFLSYQEENQRLVEMHSASTVLNRMKADLRRARDIGSIYLDKGDAAFFLESAQTKRLSQYLPSVENFKSFNDSFLNSAQMEAICASLSGETAAFEQIRQSFGLDRVKNLYDEISSREQRFNFETTYTKIFESLRPQSDADFVLQYVKNTSFSALVSQLRLPDGLRAADFGIAFPEFDDIATANPVRGKSKHLRKNWNVDRHLAIFSVILSLLLYYLQERSSNEWQDKTDKTLVRIEAACSAINKKIELLSELAASAARNEASKRQIYVSLERKVLIRSYPEHGAKKIAFIKPHETVVAISGRSNWIEVEYTDRSSHRIHHGWVLKKYFKRLAN